MATVSEMDTESLMFIYMWNEKRISELYAKQKDIREELGKRLGHVEDKIRRGEIRLEGGMNLGSTATESVGD